MPESPEKKKSLFTPETARLAGVKSGASRRPIEKDKDGRRVYAYLCQSADLIAARLLTGYTPCPHCKRGGPMDPRLMDSLSRTLHELCQTILHYAWGRPAQESKSGREASLEEYKRMAREARAEDNKAYVPKHLPYDDLSDIDNPENLEQPEAEEHSEQARMDEVRAVADTAQSE